jgi:tetratricopeptide (TPR) repeat protein
MKSNRLISAIIGMIAVTSVAAQDATALYNEGVKLKGEKKSKEAIAKFEQAISLKPDYYDAIYELGWCQNDNKNYTGALSSLRKVRPVWSSTYKVHFELGYAFEKLSLYDSAIASYGRCLEINEANSGVHRQLGYIAYNKDDYAKALEHFRNFETRSKTEPTDYLYWYRKGFCNNALKNYTEAIAALEKSLQYKADYMNTFLELGFANSRLKKDDEAISYYNKALAIDPKSHVPYNGIAEVYRDNKKDIPKAMEWYQKTLSVKADERKACFGMGYCLNSQGKYDDAISYLKKAISQEDSYTAAYVELGYAYYMTKRNEDAITNLNKAMSLNPSNENSRYYLGLVYIDKKDKAKAQQMADELKKLSSKNADKLQTKVNAM